MKTLLRIVEIVVAVVALSLVVVSNYGTVESRLECSGAVKEASGRNAQIVTTTPATLYAKVETYRWFIVWTDYDAMITWEIRPQRYTGFGYYTLNDVNSPIVNFDGTRNSGSFSPLSRSIYIQPFSDGSGWFDGMCKAAT